MDSSFQVDVTGISSDTDHDVLPLHHSGSSTLTADEGKKELIFQKNLPKRRKCRRTIHDYKYKEERRRKRLEKKNQVEHAEGSFKLHIVGSCTKEHLLGNTPNKNDLTSTEAFSNGHCNSTSTDAYSDNIHAHNVSVQTNETQALPLFASRYAQHRRTRRMRDIPPETYLEQCISEIKRDGFLHQLLTVFDQQELLPHFMSLLRNVHNGSLDPDNIAVLLCLERAFLQNQHSSTQMRYSDRSKQFWELMYRIGGGEVIRLMSGPKHFNKVNTEEVEKNKYIPSVGDFNFAVPDEKILAKSIFQLPKEVYPGVIESCLQLLSPDEEYFLSVDAKQCMQGLKLGLDNYGYGDIDLWGHEDPSLQSRKDDLDSDLAHVDNMMTISLDNRQHLLTQVRNLANTVNIISHCIQKVRQGIVRHEIMRRSFQKKIDKGLEKPSKYTYAFSNIEAFKLAAKDNISHLLHCNQEICRIMAHLNETSHFFPHENNIDLTKQTNCNLLLPPDQIADEVFLDRNPEYIKQRSEKWFHVRGKAHVTASTMYNALGLGKTSNKMNHFRQYVLKQPQKPVQKHIQDALDHGTRHEASLSYVDRFIEIS